jgi:hypothetical protein
MEKNGGDTEPLFVSSAGVVADCVALAITLSYAAVLSRGVGLGTASDVIVMLSRTTEIIFAIASSRVMRVFQKQVFPDPIVPVGSVMSFQLFPGRPETGFF